ncbi:hypothetical protein RRG08_055627 [Elysia crispata]|uniref:Uncharacterized protein n=1 Tax=Elysia crispata TaxID=231223 RepID=A0AAE1DBL3_9GAST|nr:hypothetical protein RRG08_055627 [Elysia crispata]
MDGQDTRESNKVSTSPAAYSLFNLLHLREKSRLNSFQGQHHRGYADMTVRRTLCHVCSPWGEVNISFRGHNAHFCADFNGKVSSNENAVWKVI